MTNKFNFLKKRKSKKGFTLIELVIVVAIIGILALLVVPQFSEVTDDSKQKVFEGNHRTIISAIGMYQAGNNGDYPPSPGDLDPYLATPMSTLQGQPTGATYIWVGPTGPAGTANTLTSTYDGTTLTYP